MELANEQSYPTPYANSPLLPLLLLSLATQKHAPTTKTEYQDEYDYIIVGAGSAGSVVASRLSEIPCVSVLLLEAGKPPPLLSDIPAIARSFLFTDIDWSYSTTPQKYTAAGHVDRRVPWPSGKTLGGSSTVNAMLYVRGNRRNYDEWAELGAEGWSYDEVLPYFKILEDNTDPEYLQNGFHAAGGPITVSRPDFNPPAKLAEMEAVMNEGFDFVDPNAFEQIGFFDYQASIRKGQRCGTAKAYLVPAENRSNLDILSNAMVRKVVIEDKQAVGVEFDFNGATRVVRARKEVILSAGTTNTAQLLMLSGIGPMSELMKHKIPLVADLPVGLNFHDHPATFIQYELNDNSNNCSDSQNGKNGGNGKNGKNGKNGQNGKNGRNGKNGNCKNGKTGKHGKKGSDNNRLRSFDDEIQDNKNIQDYINKRKGPLTSGEGFKLMSFLRNYDNDDDGIPDHSIYFTDFEKKVALQLGLNSEMLEKVVYPNANKTTVHCAVQLLHTKSMGSVSLQSDDPYDPPVIDPNYFEDFRDIEDMVQGLKTCQRIMNNPAMQRLGAKPLDAIIPGCEDFVTDEDLYLRCLVRTLVITTNHQVGTARMGDPSDPRTVVDPELRVKGIQSLRVVDASIMPTVPWSNTNIPTIMVGEKASDMIKETIECEK